MLYGAETWTLKRSDLYRMQSEQRKMLRMMIQTPRRVLNPELSAGEETDSETGVVNDDGTDDGHCDNQRPLLEDWISWIKRATNLAEEQLCKAQVTDWVREQRKRYWDFAGRVARCSDSRWSCLVVNWVPDGGFRRVGTPCKHWTDDIDHFCKHELDGDSCEWFVLAQNLDTWNSLSSKFVQAFVLF